MTTIAHYRSATMPVAPRQHRDLDAVVGDAAAIARHIDAGDPLFWALRLLPAPQRNTIYALRAFCCAISDIVDSGASPTLKCALLSEWRCELARLFAGRPQHKVTGALLVPVYEHGLRCEEFLAFIDGKEQEARRDVRAPSLAELDLHCERVAVSIGRIALRVLGIGAPAAEPIAAELGRALQLTRILHDLADDAKRFRLYLPRELLHQHGVFATMPSFVLAQPSLPQICRDLAKFAEAHYAAAAAAIAAASGREIRPVTLLLVLHRALLEQILQRGWQRLDRRVSVPQWRMAMLALRFGVAGA
jgi:phytoene synthase